MPYFHIALHNYQLCLLPWSFISVDQYSVEEFTEILREDYNIYGPL